MAAWTYALLGLSLYFLITAKVPNAALSVRGRNILACGLALPLVFHLAYL
jgi:hypothetical protein